MTTTLKVAMSESDRTAQLLSGAHRLPGFELDVRRDSIEDIFVNQMADAAYDVSELSLASYLIAKSRGETRLTAIPVFLSRSFRHNAIYVRADSPWQHPSELRGKRFGFPEYQMTAAVWVRGLFRQEWGVATEEMQWFTFRDERVPVQTPATRLDGDLFAALADGRVDAVMSARRPGEQWFPASGEGGVLRRLIPDVWEVERAYYRKTGIFPIMHLVSLKADTVASHPELPLTLYEQMFAIKEASVKELYETIKNQTCNPWAWETAEASAALMNGDIWPYELAANRAQLATFIACLQADGLLERHLEPEELFHASVAHT